MFIVCVYLYKCYENNSHTETAKSGSLREHMINFQMSNYYSIDFSSSERLP